jgi:ubiquinol-cytochrome c reductase cytochrome c1 subunit
MGNVSFFSKLAVVRALSVVCLLLFNPAYGYNQAALHRGAVVYSNYCAGCHSLRYLSTSQMAQDLGLVMGPNSSEPQANPESSLLLKGQLEYLLRVSLPSADALQWFGVVPPDLSLVASERGNSWIIDYLKGFYPDNTRPFGSNNSLVHQVAMPNVLQPFKQPGQTFIDELNHHHESYLVPLNDETATLQAFDAVLDDLVTFLDYVADPNKETRHAWGVLVLIFLFIFLLLAYQLKRLYWRE